MPLTRMVYYRITRENILYKATCMHVGKGTMITICMIVHINLIHIIHIIIIWHYFQ